MNAFFDTNVLDYALDRAHPAKRAIAAELLGAHIRERSLVISTQVMLELYATVLRRKLLDPRDARQRSSGSVRSDAGSPRFP